MGTSTAVLPSPPQGSAGRGPTLPFRGQTKHRKVRVGIVPYVDGQPGQPLKIPPVGYIAGLELKFTGTLNMSSGGALTDKAPWNMFNRVTFSLNLGSANPYDVSGFGTYATNYFIERGFAPDKPGVGNANVSAAMYAFPVASGVNTFVLHLFIPINMNSDNNFSTGLINLQAKEIQAYLNITFGTAVGAAGNNVNTGVGSGGVTNGQVEVYYHYWDLPANPNVQQPPFVWVRRIEDTLPITQTGDQTYTFLRQGSLVNVVHIVTLNGTRSDNIDLLKLIINDNDLFWTESGTFNKVNNRLRTGMDLPTGVFCYDLMHANQMMQSGDLRDAINSEGISQLQSIVTVNSGATLGSNNSLATIRTLIQALTANS